MRDESWSDTMTLGMMGGMTRRVSSDVIVGRAEELASVDAALAALDDGDTSHPNVLLISGEAGIGKTRMLDALAEAGRESGAVVAVGGCLEHGTEIRPLGAIVEVLAALIDSADDSATDQHDLGWLIDADRAVLETELSDPA